MNITAIEKALKTFITKHSVHFHNLAVRETALLEVGALTMASEHYRISGHTVTVENSKSGLFVAKLSSRGHPFNFSWFKCAKGDEVYEIHSNLAVEGAHRDGAIYVVDVAVVEGSDAVPKIRPKKPWPCLDNKKLCTFIEVKKLVVYPMLLAQFIGIVHEIVPRSLRKQKAIPQSSAHFPPSLVTLGYLQGTSSKVLNGFAKRKYQICVVHNFDVHLSSMRRGAAKESPFLLIKALV